MKIILLRDEGYIASSAIFWISHGISIIDVDREKEVYFVFLGKLDREKDRVKDTIISTTRLQVVPSLQVFFFFVQMYLHYKLAERERTIYINNDKINNGNKKTENP